MKWKGLGGGELPNTRGNQARCPLLGALSGNTSLSLGKDIILGGLRVCRSVILQTAAGFSSLLGSILTFSSGTYHSTGSLPHWTSSWGGGCPDWIKHLTSSLPAKIKVAVVVTLNSFSWPFPEMALGWDYWDMGHEIRVPDDPTDMCMEARMLVTN